MKRLACLSLVALFSLSMAAQAQVLPPGAADCALGLIRFRAWAVTGLEMVVTPEMLSSWRYYVANATLPDQYSVASACWELNNITAKWPQMPPVEREVWQNMWETSLGQNIDFIAPVFPDAAVALRYALMKRVAERLRDTPQNAAPGGTQDDAITEIQRRIRNAEQLRRFNETFYGPH